MKKILFSILLIGAFCIDSSNGMASLQQGFNQVQKGAVTGSKAFQSLLSSGQSAAMTVVNEAQNSKTAYNKTKNTVENRAKQFKQPQRFATQQATKARTSVNQQKTALQKQFTAQKRSMSAPLTRPVITPKQGIKAQPAKPAITQKKITKAQPTIKRSQIITQNRAPSPQPTIKRKSIVVQPSRAASPASRAVKNAQANKVLQNFKAQRAK